MQWLKPKRKETVLNEVLNLVFAFGIVVGWLWAYHTFGGPITQKNIESIKRYYERGFYGQ
jgi:hypothetical protein